MFAATRSAYRTVVSLGAQARQVCRRSHLRHGRRALLLIMGLSATGALAPVAAGAGTVGVLPTRPDHAAVATSTSPTTVGMRFSPKVAGEARGIRVYKSARGRRASPTVGTLWSAAGRRLAEARFTPAASRGWQRVRFAHPVVLKPGRTYTVSAFAPHGRYAVTDGDFTRTRSTDFITAPGRRNGVFRRGAAPGFPRNARGSNNYWVDVMFAPSWPGPATTGVPAGTTLRPYGGPCTITEPTTITGVDATSCDALLVLSPDVLITDSLLPRVDATAGESRPASVTLVDDTVRAGEWEGGAIWGYNITATRVEVTGGQHSVHCNDNCTVVDSWLHHQWNPDGQSFHNNAFISNGGTDMVIRHNTLHCTALPNSTDGGCTADLSLFGDFDPISHVTIDHNLFVANARSISYCLYGGHSPGKPYGDNPTYIQVTDNVFQRGSNDKCGVYGPVTSFKVHGKGNLWSGNTWDSGAVIRAEDGLW